MHSLLLFLRYYYSKIFGAVVLLSSIFVILSLSSCSQPSLSSFTEFIDNDYTAGAQLGIEQGAGHDELFGQQVVVTWSLPYRMQKLLPATLHLSIYYGDGKTEKLTYEVRQLSGYSVYCLKGDDYYNRQGIVSYKVSLLSEDKEIVSRRHHIWTEVIAIDTFGAP
ncbi:hypothetical protein BOKEGFJH_00441 [Chlamydia avium]|uniref:Lipoprotein n=1 Tax=Chlamydia avium TaxID=1457141 RepID=A0ABP2X637_9CHLA|nr:hypothetical protein [Chlamydia avium]EPP38078.1 hypothetical protein CP10881SC42_0865 [Chlamydia avium]VVT42918.1 hypothetical protein BOKEGFJH_00441 [Chlamydia avium]